MVEEIVEVKPKINIFATNQYDSGVKTVIHNQVV